MAESVPSPDLYEKLGVFYLGKTFDAEEERTTDDLLLYDSKDLLTHGVCVGMTGSGKTGLCISLLEEAALDGIPALIVDPKGDLGNLLLRFPQLAPEDFLPWVDEAEARRRDQSPESFAASQAELWTEGLASWGQDGERIARLAERAEITVYTPGSDAGLPVSILASFQAPPPAVREDGDLLNERVGSTAASLLGLLGIDADPLKSREHILLANLLSRAWSAGEGYDLSGLIRAVQAPPFDKVGVFDLESFFPEKDRRELAMALNNLLAAPTFASWLGGEPLDVDRLLYTPEGKPRQAIFSIAHLSEPERMFFVSLLLNQTLAWMRQRPGSSSLQALLYMDEVFGYMPPVANPPSKRALLTLLKQARAFGLGVLLATQNPVDLDYKGLSNTGTWFLGRLQTEQDKARILDGLEGAAGSSFDRAELSRLISGLGKRVFLLLNVHEDGPVLFHTRWAMSYLRGPMTRVEIQQLMGPKKEQLEAAKVDDESQEAAAAPAAPAAVTDPQAQRPVLPSGTQEIFVPPSGGLRGDGILYEPAYLGSTEVSFVDARRGIEHQEREVLILPLSGEELVHDWAEAEREEIPEEDLERDPRDGAHWGSLPAAAAESKQLRAQEKALSDFLYRQRRLEIFESPLTKERSQPLESERDFRIRLAETMRERRDEASEALREKYAPRLARQQEQIERAGERLEKEEGQASSHKSQALFGVLGAAAQVLFGRKKLSATSISKAKTAMRGISRSREQSDDVGRAEERLEREKLELEEMEEKLQRELEDIASDYDASKEVFKTIHVKPRRRDVVIRLFALGWVPRARRAGR
ncbi:MAG: ATP-binding protein [Acidobacteriota bacterium]